MLVTFSLHVSNLKTASPKVSNLMSVLFVYRYSLFLVIDIYITWIWVYMKSLSSWSGGGDEKKKVHRSLRHTSFYNSWSWRESNPRPNEETISFLHAYLCLRFSSASKTRATNLRLILYVFAEATRRSFRYSRFCCAVLPNASEQELLNDIPFPLL